VKIYIASSFSLTEKVAQLAKVLESYGHTITVRWWDRSFDVEGEGQVHTQELKARYEELEPEEFYRKPGAYTAFITDFMGVKEAEALVFVAAEQPRKYNGATVELGIALGDNKPCFSLGNLEKSVLFYPVQRCRSPQDLVECLEVLA
jgi:hypothetical protein